MFAVAQDVAAKQALFLEAEFFEQGVGAEIAQVGARRQPAKAQRRGIGEHSAHRLQRVTLAPGLAAQQEAHLGPLVPAIYVGEVAGPQETTAAEGLDGPVQSLAGNRVGDLALDDHPDQVWIVDLGDVPVGHDLGIIEDREQEFGVGDLQRSQAQAFSFKNHGLGPADRTP